MLVLSRKKEERLFIGEGANLIEVYVVHIGKDTVRLGVNAPREVKIIRGELVLKSEEVTK